MPSCGNRNFALQNRQLDYNIMKKFLLTYVFLMSTVLTFTAHAQLLYRVSGNGLGKPSYILGTYHLAPSAFSDSIPGFRQAMAEVGQVCGELDMELVKTPENTMKMLNAMMLPEGKTIQGMLGEEEMKSLNAFVKSLMGTDFSNPLVGDQLGKMTPAALTTQFSLLMYMKMNPNFSAEDGIDTYVQTLGRQQGKKILGLETIDEQIHVLFGSQSLERQLQLLMCMVRHQDYQMQMAGELVKAYYAQDIKRIEEITDQKYNDECDSSPEEENTLIYGRNANWANAMPRIMSEQPTFFAVGAAHLIGEKGLINLLQEKGFSVKAVQ